MRSERYHHGELREALLVAAEQELIEKGEDGFSLRSTAKRAGVSHAAPAHHFKDVAALLHGLAQRGFDRLTMMMKDEQARKGNEDPVGLLVGAGVGYVRFATENPALFQLMFGARSKDGVPPDLAKAGDAGFSVLVNAVAKLRGPEALANDTGWRDVVGAWAMVHGLSHLLIGGKLRWLQEQPVERWHVLIEELVRRSLELPRNENA